MQDDKHWKTGLLWRRNEDHITEQSNVTNCCEIKVSRCSRDTRYVEIGVARDISKVRGRCLRC